VWIFKGEVFDEPAAQVEAAEVVVPAQEQPA
jgi:hypothetical protein